MEPEALEYKCDECGKQYLYEDIGYIGPSDSAIQSCSPFQDSLVICKKCLDNGLIV